MVSQPVQGASAGVLKSNHEAHAIRTAGREWLAPVLDRNLIHVATVVIRANLDDGSLNCGHSIRVIEVDHR
jgi:hypothetical protein